jgi:hypothetical protein
MGRINVYRYATDAFEETEHAGWFSEDSATRYSEATDWNGNNHISRNTGSQWEHEELYRTAQGRWVLGRYSNWQGTLPSHEYVTDDVARQWLMRNDEDGAVKQWFGEIEEERGPGRPEIGPAVNMRFPQAQLDAIDARAKTEGVSRAEMIRRLIGSAL